MNAKKVEKEGKQMKYTAVIVTYNRLNLLEECIGHVLKQTLPFCSITIINNCSLDGTAAYLDKKQSEFPVLSVHHMPENLGGAGGFSYGLSKIDLASDYVLIIDDDAMIEEEFIEKIDASLTVDVLAYSGSVYINGMIDWSHRRRLKNRILMSKTEVPEAAYKNKFFDYDLSTFCGLIISTKLIGKIGLPGAEYFIWYDDTEYSLRIRKYTKIRNISSAHINHKAVVSKDHKLGWKSYYGYRNMWDMGLRYSRCPVIYHLYKISFHLYKILICILKASFNIDRIHNKNMIRLHLDVLKFAADRKLGFNNKYTFSTKI